MTKYPMYPRLTHPEPMQPGQAELMGALNELSAVNNRQELRAFATEYQRDVPMTDMPVRPGPDPRRAALRNDMTDFETTSFPRMGDEPLTDHLVDVSGRSSRYTRYMPRDAKGVGVGGTTAAPDITDDDTPGTGTKRNRKQALQPAQLTGAAHRIATVIAGGQADAPQRGYTVRGPYQRNAAAAANPGPGPYIVQDGDSWQN